MASVLLMMLTGRIAGISGILGGCLSIVAGDKVWRLAFIVGLILAPVRSKKDRYSITSSARPSSVSAPTAAAVGIFAHWCQIASNSDPFSRPIPTPSSRAGAGLSM
jgi:hypothetical protein